MLAAKVRLHVFEAPAGVPLIVAAGEAAPIVRLGVLGPRVSTALPASHEQSVAAARAALGEETFAAAWAEGRAMTLEQAVAYALDEQPSA